MQTLRPWDELKRGLDCPLCPANRNTDFYWLIRSLRLSSLYLTKVQTYRGSCALIVDGRHVNYIGELLSDEWALVAQDLRDAERAVRRVFAPDHLNLECLGNTVPHLHWGLLPRYRNDGRWGHPIWTTTRSEMKQEFLTDGDCSSYVEKLQQALDAT